MTIIAINPVCPGLLLVIRPHKINNHYMGIYCFVVKYTRIFTHTRKEIVVGMEGDITYFKEAHL